MSRPGASFAAALLAVLAGALGGGCAVGPPATAFGYAAAAADGPGRRDLASLSVPEPVRDLPKARRGNMAEYTVFGRRYRTLGSASGFRERGTASWYGAKFHGRDTSSGEPFDMHAMTAAHKSLPLPTFVRVSDVATGRSIVVKVNDRGPFVDDRVIDLSYAAALQLGMLDEGTAEVVVEALSTHVEPPAASPAAPPTAPPAAASPAAPPSVGHAVGVAGSATDGARFIQLGAFSDGANAESLARRVAPRLGQAPRVEHDAARALYRVRIGPLADAAAVRATLLRLEGMGLRAHPIAATDP